MSVWFFSISTFAAADPWFKWEYFSGTSTNPFISENLLLERVDSQVYFDWIWGSPDSSVPTDTFTARWQGILVSNQTWTHTFRTSSDDGIRLFIDDVAIINNWTNHAETINTATISLSAWVEYDIRLEYFENSGNAVAELDWRRPGDAGYISLNGTYVTHEAAPNVAPTNISLSNNVLLDWQSAWTLVGTLTTDDANLSDTHTYSFIAWFWSNDNAHFTLSWSQIITNTSVNFATQSSYTIRVQTSDGTFSYDEIFTISVVTSFTDGFCASYYNWTATSPYLTSNIITKRTDVTINYNWWTGSPWTGIPNDDFTVRWEWYIESDETWLHSFRTLSDDGVRLYIDDTSIINNWTNHGSTYDIGTYSLIAGEKYKIRMEFYERSWWAVARLNWQKPSEWAYSVIDGNDVWYVGSCELIDTTNPIISQSSPNLDSLIPKHDFDINFVYSDNIGWDGIDINSSSFSFYKWNGSNWGADIQSSYIDGSGSVVTSTIASYPTLWVPYWKYKAIFSISDLNWNLISWETIFYVDEPNFIISTPEIDIWELSNISSKFSNTVIVTVETLWAPFRVSMNISNDLSILWDDIPLWDGKYVIMISSSPIF